MSSKDKIDAIIDEIIASIKEGEIDFEELMEIHHGNVKTYPEMLLAEKRMLKKLNELTSMLRKPKGTSEVTRYEILAMEALGRRALKDLQKKIDQVEMVIISGNELLGKELQVLARDDDDKPILVTYLGRHNARLLEALKKDT